ncbi:hypothetical protein CR513_58433, partial [Mucuna pruriens]
MKLLAVEIIYPISDNQWVSPKDKLVLTRIHNTWRVYIDYRKLNQATRKDHFPLSGKTSRKIPLLFSGQIFEYMQIHITLVDQHKNTFTCPFGTFAYTRMLFGLCNAPSTF